MRIGSIGHDPTRVAFALIYTVGRSCLYQRVGISWGVFPEYPALHLQFVATHSAYARMTDKRTRKFTPSDDALILQQPLTRVGLNKLATMLQASQERVMRRADELGVSLAISGDYFADTRALRCSHELVDPLLERLKQVHGDQK